MNTSPENNYPQICSDVGLTCESCTRETARQLAATCKGLRGKMVGQLFVQLYPNPACAPMHAHFAACYREASAELSAEDSAPLPAFERREVTVARPRAMVAVA
jgi:hypothetical protein